MARVNYRQVQDRFKHIDAQFVSCTLGFEAGEPAYTVSLYPWWEHPKFIKAADEGKTWRFTGGDSRNVTVYPIDLLKFHISRSVDVIDWGFSTSHPRLWPYENTTQIICNTDPPLAEVVARVREALPRISPANIYKYLDPLIVYKYKAPFCLGRFPQTLFAPVKTSLDEFGVKTFCSPSGGDLPKDFPILFLIDDTDYIIATDFELDVPEFEHRPEWVCVSDT